MYEAKMLYSVTQFLLTHDAWVGKICAEKELRAFIYRFILPMQKMPKLPMIHIPSFESN